MRILFLFIGEPHHVFHALPIAAEMQALAPEVSIEVALASEAHLPMLKQMIAAYPDFTGKVRMIGQRGPARWMQRLGLIRHPRVPTLLPSIPYLRRFDAIVVPERTTTAIRHFLKKTNRLIFTPHGAGDREIMLDPRDRHFDFVLVAGEKSEKRLLEARTIRPGSYAVNGYVKLDLMRRLQPLRAPLFDNDRSTIVYAPHFRRSLSSWDRLGRAVIAWFAGQDRYNLVVAPHVRLFSEATTDEILEVMRFAIPGKIIVDLTSERLFDMTYTEGADIYLGDVSSQVYEFLARPRPCIFLNAHGIDWRNDPNYRFWKLGDVVSDIAGLERALVEAPARHPVYAAAQHEAMIESTGGDPAGAARRGAEAILRFLNRPDDADAGEGTVAAPPARLL